MYEAVVTVGSVGFVKFADFVAIGGLFFGWIDLSS